MRPYVCLPFATFLITVFCSLLHWAPCCPHVILSILLLVNTCICCFLCPKFSSPLAVWLFSHRLIGSLFRVTIYQDGLLLTTLYKITSFPSSFIFILPCCFFFFWCITPWSIYLTYCLSATLILIGCKLQESWTLFPVHIPITCNSGWHSVGAQICCWHCHDVVLSKNC